LWETVLQRKVPVIVFEDNEAGQRIIETGKNPSMKHIGRTHRVDLAWLHERYIHKNFLIRRCDTKDQAADIFAKSFPSSKVVAWNLGLKNIAHCDPSQANWKIKAPASKVPTAAIAAGGSQHPGEGKEPGKDNYNRTIIEYCCGTESKLGTLNRASKGCKRVR